MSSLDPKDEELLRAWMHDFAATPLSESKSPNPDFIWWKGELLRRLEAQQRTTATLDFGERACAGIGVAAALALGIYLSSEGLPPLLLIATITTLVVLIAFASVTLFRSAER